MIETFWWLLGFPLYWARNVIGIGPYGWVHVRWLRAYCRKMNGIYKTGI